MQRRGGVTVMHVPHTGHTPVLDAPRHIGFIRDWLDGRADLGEEFSALPGKPC
jgi:hypothetical protein